jgi:predicted deacetylase
MIYVLLLYVVAMSLSVATPIWAQSARDTLYIVIRVDDIISRNTSYLPSSIVPFQEVVEARGGKVSWGVIPRRIMEPNVNKGEMTRDLRRSVLRGHELVQHGYLHICVQCNSSGHEMYCVTNKASLPIAQQEKLIADGIKILVDSIGVRPTSFIPPGHAQDDNTLVVLRNERFQAVTLSRNEGNLNGLYNIGTSADHGWTLTNETYVQRRTAALADLRKKAYHGLYTLLLHDPFTRKGYLDGIVLRWTGEVLDSIKIEYGERLKFVTISEAARRRKALLTSLPPSDGTSPAAYYLGQNYPNPFNPTTIIPYQVAVASQVRLEVVNLSGQKVMQLLDRPHAPGQYQFQWDASGLPSGLYWYRMITPTQTLTKTMVLLK